MDENTHTLSDFLTKPQPFEVDLVTGPAFLASALVNGDTSGLSPKDLECLHRFEAKLGQWYVVDVAAGEPRFTWSFDLYGGDARGGDVIDYVVHRRPPTCQIRWIDADGNPTDDTNPAIGRVRTKEHWQMIAGRNTHFTQSEWFHICAEHAKHLDEPGMEYWEFERAQS
jgi:hypothetical protein